MTTTYGPIENNQPTDAQWELSDQIALALEEMRDAVPSAIARKIKADVDYFDVYRMLEWMVRNQLALKYGNGRRTHYQPWDRFSPLARRA